MGVNTVRLTLRTWLLLLAGVSALPMLVLATWVLWSYKNDQQRVIQERLKARTEVLAQSVGERIKTAVGTLQGIAESNAAMAQDLPT